VPAEPVPASCRRHGPSPLAARAAPGQHPAVAVDHSGAPLVPPGAAAPRTAAPYEHALADAAFRERVRLGYVGEHDVLDALWWLEHPDDAGPSGAAPPNRLLTIARRSLYGPRPTDSDHYALAALQEQADRERLLVAVRVAAAEPPPTAAAAPARRSVVIWAACTAVLGALVAAALLAGDRPAPVAAVAPPRASVAVELAVVPGDELAADPAGPRPPVLTRRLATVGDTQILAELTRGLMCLELRTDASGAFTCRSIAAFRLHGLEVPFPTGSDDLEGVQWLPDGRLRLSIVR
jgi:hypothetical protein